MDKITNLELRKKALASLLGSAMALSAVAGCNAKTNTNQSSSNVTTTAVETSVDNTVINTIEAKKEQASEEYMIHAKAVAEVMYKANKEYFDEKEFTPEDLENVYYVLNGKYYDKDNSIIMEKPELDRSLDIIRELIMPQRINEMLQKYRDLEHGNISFEDYLKEANASKFYDYRASLVNFIDVNEDNNDIRNFVNEYSVEMVKVTENVKNGVTPEEHLTEFFAKVRSAQTGNITDYKDINTYLQETNTEDGYGFIVAGIYKSTADFLNTVIDGVYVNVQNEKVRIGLNYNERILLNTYYLGDLVNYDDIYKAKRLESELFQTMPLDVMCDKEDKITTNFGYEPVRTNTKSL